MFHQLIATLIHLANEFGALHGAADAHNHVMLAEGLAHEFRRNGAAGCVWKV